MACENKAGEADPILQRTESTEFDMNWEEGHFHFGGNKPKTSFALPKHPMLEAAKKAALASCRTYDDADFEKPIRIAAVGLGGILEAHEKGMAGVKGHKRLFEITVLCDPNEEMRRKGVETHPNAKIFETLTEAIEKANGDFDACLLMIPVHLHEKLAIEALRAGKHTLLEKPFCATVEECRKVMDVADEMAKQGVVFMVGENAEWWPEIVTARQLIADGAIGKIIAAKTYYHEVMAEAPFIKAYTEGDWRWKPELAGGGCVMDAGTHWLRGLLKICGYQVESVVGQCQSPVPLFKGETIGKSVIHLPPGEFHDGLLANFDCIAAGAPIDLTAPWFTFTGTEGEITIDPFFDGGLNLFNKWAKYGCHTNCGGYFEAFGTQMIQFAKSIKAGKTEGGNRPEFAANEIAVIRAMYESSDKGLGFNVVKVPDFAKVDPMAKPRPAKIYPQ